ncbi:MAG: TetR/AcrR family transcriptional regulator [Gammaproteobacteria bacterium]|nr:TetR/AcrR family transcriptional regulator [Gammaproteobacteria bacterium]
MLISNNETPNAEQDQADLRRSQLIDIAARLIDEEGIDAARYARIAKEAGCTRSLVYHYFPKVTDLHAQIAERFYEKLSSHVNAPEQPRAAIEKYTGSSSNPETITIFGAVFDLFEENGIAPLILRYNAELNPDYAPNSEQKWYFEGLFASILEDNFSIPSLQSALFIEYCFNIVKTCFLYYRNGRMTREQAIEEIDTTINQLIRRFQ